MFFSLIPMEIMPSSDDRRCTIERILGGIMLPLKSGKAIPKSC